MIHMLFSNLSLIALKDREQRTAMQMERVETEEEEQGEGQGEGQEEGGVSVSAVEGDNVSRDSLDEGQGGEDVDEEAVAEKGMRLWDGTVMWVDHVCCDVSRTCLL